MPDWLRPTDICVVTGGCNGLGEAILQQLGKAGCPTVALDIAVPGDEEVENNTTASSATPANNTTVSVEEPGLPSGTDRTTDSKGGRKTSGTSKLSTHANGESIQAETSSAKRGLTEAAQESSTVTSKGGLKLDTRANTSGSGIPADVIPQFDDADTTVEDVTKPSLVIKCDVRSQEDLARARNQIFEKFQRYPTILICNAGVRRPLNSIADTEFEDIEETIEVNLSGPLKCMRTFLPDILEAKRGFVVTVGSALGLICPKGLSVYGASKAGILGFHEALEQEVSSYKDVHALLVCPGQIDTSMFADIQTPSERFAPIVEPDKLALKIVKRIKKAKTSTVYAPAYVRYLSLVRAVPTPIASLARKWSGVDRVYDDLVAERQKAAAAEAASAETPHTDDSVPEKSSSTLDASPTADVEEPNEKGGKGGDDATSLHVPRKRASKKNDETGDSPVAGTGNTQSSRAKWFQTSFFNRSRSHHFHHNLDNEACGTGPFGISNPSPTFISCPTAHSYTTASHNDENGVDGDAGIITSNVDTGFDCSGLGCDSSE